MTNSAEPADLNTTTAAVQSPAGPAGAPGAGPDGLTVELPETVDLPRAGDLHEQLAAAEGQPVRILACHVQFIGAPAFQVLLAAAASWQRAGVGFELADASPGFQACGRRLGIDPAAFTPDFQTQGNQA